MSPKGKRLSAGVVVVRCIDGRYRYLLLRAFRYWDFPKGLVEPGESSIDAARREVREETGLTDLEFRWGEQYTETAPYANGKTARYYLALATIGDIRLAVNPALGRAEHHEFRWIDYEEARTIVGPRVLEVLEWAHRVLGARC
ncbi:MAG: bis(5'-nucleosyl)-tetraphosphatase [Sulfurifustis sp.]